MTWIAERYSEYRIMWLLVFFDMPTETKQQRKAYATFRKQLLCDGFTMFQFSVYIRNCQSGESADVHRKRVENIIPQWGKIGILTVTDKQFGQMKIIEGTKHVSSTAPTAVQLEFF